jgi:O-antigen/teichoic acid export membrane protein
VNGFLNSHDAGVYAVVAGLAEAMYLLPSAIGINVFSRISRGGTTQMTAEVFRSIAVVYGAVCVLSMLLAKPAIDFMYGPEFSEVVELYYWLLPGVFALGMITIISNHLAGRGYPTEAVYIWIAGLALNVLLNVTLLPTRGLYIASLASTIAYVMLLILHMALLGKDVGGWRELIPRPREFGRFIRTAVSRSRS